MVVTLHIILLIVAMVCFGIAWLRQWSARFDWLAAGLFFFAASFLVG